MGADRPLRDDDMQSVGGSGTGPHGQDADSTDRGDDTDARDADTDAQDADTDAQDADTDAQDADSTDSRDA